MKTCGLFTDTCVRINRIGQFSSARSVKEPIRKEHELFMRTRKVKWVDSRSVSVCKIVRGFPAILNRFSKSSYCLKLDPLSLTYKNQYPPPPVTSPHDSIYFPLMVLGETYVWSLSHFFATCIVPGSCILLTPEPKIESLAPDFSKFSVIYRVSHFIYFFSIWKTTPTFTTHKHTKQNLQSKPIPASFSNMQVLGLNPTFVW